MAVAACQSLVVEMTALLRKKGKNVRIRIHPSTGLKPAELDELLAGAGTLYDIVQDIEELNNDFPDTDLSLVIGANDIINPTAQDNPDPFCESMPVFKVWKSSQSVVMKRTLGVGAAAFDNPIFYYKNNAMLFGSAMWSCKGILDELKKHYGVD